MGRSSRQFNNVRCRSCGLRVSYRVYRRHHLKEHGVLLTAGQCVQDARLSANDVHYLRARLNPISYHEQQDIVDDTIDEKMQAVQLPDVPRVWEFERIVDHKTTDDGRNLFFVAWKGCDEKE